MSAVLKNQNIRIAVVLIILFSRVWNKYQVEIPRSACSTPAERIREQRMKAREAVGPEVKW